MLMLLKIYIQAVSNAAIERHSILLPQNFEESQKKKGAKI